MVVVVLGAVGFEMIQEHYICCARDSYDYINSTSDHQVGDLCPKMF